MTDSYAGYVQANLQILPRLELDAGVRDTHDDKSANFATVIRNALGIGSIIANEGPEHPDVLRHQAVVSGLRCRTIVADRTILLFGTFATGYKSGGFNSGGTSAGADGGVSAPSIPKRLKTTKSA